MAAPEREAIHIDVADDPELSRLAEDVHRTRKPRVLSSSGRDLAIVLPIEDEVTAAGRKKSPEDIAAFRESAGSWSAIDTDQLIKDIYESRKRSKRPPIEL
ncbi:MAG: hypothetical protein WBW04_06615 [Nitrolancea sp.]